MIKWLALALLGLFEILGGFLFDNLFRKSYH